MTNPLHISAHAFAGAQMRPDRPVTATARAAAGYGIDSATMPPEWAAVTKPKSDVKHVDRRVL